MRLEDGLPATRGIGHCEGRDGVIIERIVEPRATDEACAAEPSMRNHQLIPHTLLVGARRPNGRRQRAAEGDDQHGYCVSTD